MLGNYCIHNAVQEQDMMVNAVSTPILPMPILELIQKVTSQQLESSDTMDPLLHSMHYSDPADKNFD